MKKNPPVRIAREACRLHHRLEEVLVRAVGLGAALALDEAQGELVLRRRAEWHLEGGVKERVDGDGEAVEGAEELMEEVYVGDLGSLALLRREQLK